MNWVLTTKKDEINKLIRSLPDSIFFLSFYISTNGNATFEVFKNAVSTALERHENPNNIRQRNGNGTNWNNGNGGRKETNYAVRISRSRGGGDFRGRGRGRFRGGYSRRNESGCHYCGKPRHFTKVCRFRIAEEGSSRIGKRRGRGGYTLGHRGRNSYGYNNRGDDFYPENNQNG